MPPCPCCGDEYDEFVWKVSAVDGEYEGEPPDTDCETGLGWYVHE